MKFPQDACKGDGTKGLQVAGEDEITKIVSSTT